MLAARVDGGRELAFSNLAVAVVNEQNVAAEPLRAANLERGGAHGEALEGAQAGIADDAGRDEEVHAVDSVSAGEGSGDQRAALAKHGADLLGPQSLEDLLDVHAAFGAIHIDGAHALALEDAPARYIGVARAEQEHGSEHGRARDAGVR